MNEMSKALAWSFHEGKAANRCGRGRPVTNTMTAGSMATEGEGPRWKLIIAYPAASLPFFFID